MPLEASKTAECACTLKRFLRLSDEPERSDRIILLSGNPEQPDIQLNEDGESQDQRYAVIAEYVQIVEPPFEWVTSPRAPSDE